MKIRKNDKVIIMKGKDKGKTGLVLHTYPQKNSILIEGINQAKKHKKGEAKGKGELITITRPVNVSKVMLLDPVTNKPTRVGFIIEDGKKIRVTKKSKTKLVNTVNTKINETESKSQKVTKKESKKPKKEKSKD